MSRSRSGWGSPSSPTTSRPRSSRSRTRRSAPSSRPATTTARASSESGTSSGPLGSLLALGGMWLLMERRGSEAHRVRCSRSRSASPSPLSTLLAVVRLREPAEHQGRGGRNPWRAFADVWRNPHARLLFLVFGIENFGTAILSVMIAYVMKYVFDLEQYTTAFMLLYFIPAILFVPVWIRLSRRFGKRNLWIFSMSMLTIAFGGLAFVRAGDVWLVCALGVIAGVGGGCGAVVGPSIQADVIDFDERATGERKEGTYFAVWAFVRKSAFGVATMLTGLLLGLIGYEPNVEQSEATKLGHAYALRHRPGPLLPGGDALLPALPARRSRPPRDPPRARRPRLSMRALAGPLPLTGLLALALALRLPGLDWIPLHQDEGLNGWLTLALHWWGRFEYLPSDNHGPFLYYAGALFFGALGPSELSLRLAPALAGALLPLALLPARRWFPGGGLLIAGLLLAIAPGLVYFSRAAIHEIDLVLFTALWAASLARFAARPTPGWAAACGAAAAGCFVTKETAAAHGGEPGRGRAGGGGGVARRAAEPRATRAAARARARGRARRARRHAGVRRRNRRLLQLLLQPPGRRARLLRGFRTVGRVRDDGPQPGQALRMVLGADGLQRGRLPLAGAPGRGARGAAPRSAGPRARGLGARRLPDLFGASLQDTLVCPRDRSAGLLAGRLGGGLLSAGRARCGAASGDCASPRGSPSRRRWRRLPGSWSEASRTFAIATTIPSRPYVYQPHAAQLLRDAPGSLRRGRRGARRGRTRPSGREQRGPGSRALVPVLAGLGARTRALSRESGSAARLDRAGGGRDQLAASPPGAARSWSPRRARVARGELSDPARASPPRSSIARRSGTATRPRAGEPLRPGRARPWIRLRRRRRRSDP